MARAGEQFLACVVRDLAAGVGAHGVKGDDAAARQQHSNGRIAALGGGGRLQLGAQVGGGAGLEAQRQDAVSSPPIGSWQLVRRLLSRGGRALSLWTLSLWRLGSESFLAHQLAIQDV